MIFNIKQKPRSKAKINEQRIYTKFAWFPLLHKDTIYWLETVVITEMYSNCRVVSPEGFIHYGNKWKRIGISRLDPK
jgi:hypothetical protein